MRKTLLLVNGPMGAGKSVVCRELLELLRPGAYLDGDWCWMTRPFQVTEESRAMVMDNITALLGRFLRSPALQYVIFGWVMHQEEIARTILRRLDLTDTVVARYTLLCSPETLRERIEKDIAAGLRTPDAAAGRRGPDAAERSLAYLPLYEGQPTTKIMTDRLTPSQTAMAIAAQITVQGDPL